MRHDRQDGIRVVVGMATLGLQAGARPVMNAFVEEVAKRKLADVTVSQTGCIGMCRLEPIVEVYMPGKEKSNICENGCGKSAQSCSRPYCKRQAVRRVHDW